MQNIELEGLADSCRMVFEKQQGGVVCKVLIELLQPKLEHLAEESMQWVVVVSALEGMMTVEMLLIAHETPESWWKTISPKLAGAKEEPDEKSAITLRTATMAVVATRSYANGGSDKSVGVGDAQSSQQPPSLVGEVPQQEVAIPNLRRHATPDLDSADPPETEQEPGSLVPRDRAHTFAAAPRALAALHRAGALAALHRAALNRGERQNPPPPSGATPSPRTPKPL
jgi:hypothetical protein